ncbi:serine hydrolase domain-containing protein [Lactobacillus gigeriorum]|uniref:G5K952 (Beta-lactamase) n=1 Tax=Lactobacillus gigeriorum DSM 23908 = CRBIP 24.85 TaxID=1423751 RepID=I7LFW1_9LACO|nr:serine hydrolase domain-containing protein [Lactobacillus gigeriorum]KRN09991.1 hypothetical protein FC38_GL001236 [Lactobacillus gigeriorum DSM 23908 = CRBIP 24.85]CCI87018.1 G5K952 (Beta-lactamase) [Lactobacillus gigeriorum DSM 23908 = CRBIP 24.85]
MNTEKLASLFDNFVAKNHLPKAILEIQNSKDNQQIEFKHGDITEDTPFALASVTKLWVSTIIMQLIDERELTYNSIVTDFLPIKKINGLHHFLNNDYTRKITVHDLLFHRTGLPNVFFEEPFKLATKIIEKDNSYDFEDMLLKVKKTEAHFLPGERQAYYADINFLLLGKIIEIVTKISLSENVEERIAEPLKLTRSYIPETELATIPPYYFEELGYLNRPKAIISSQAAGAGISTANDLMIFLKAFIQGKLFDKRHWDEIKDYLPLQADYAPVYYGGGHMKLHAGQHNLDEKLTFIGHSGLSGAFAFYCPELDLYLTGTTDNIKRSQLCIHLMYIMLLELEKENL